MEWISMTLDGPADRAEVLITNGRDIAIAHVLFRDESYRWYCGDDYEKDLHGMPVTHWMPLPALPGDQFEKAVRLMNETGQGEHPPPIKK